MLKAIVIISIILPLIVFAYTVRGNTLLPTQLILSSINFNPINDIKMLYLSYGYPYVVVRLNKNNIEIIEQKLTSILAQSSIKNSILSIIGNLPKILTLTDLQNISLFLFKMKIQFTIFSKGNFLILKVNSLYNDLFYNGKRVYTNNLYSFLTSKKRFKYVDFHFKWLKQDLYIYSYIKTVKLKNLLFPPYSIKAYSLDLHRQKNVILRNGWNYERSGDIITVNPQIINYSLTSLSFYFQYVYFKLFLNLNDYSPLMKVGIIIPYIGVSIDSDMKISIFVNDYKNIICGFLDNSFAVFFNFDNITFGYMNYFFLGVKYRSLSYMIGYNPNANNFKFKILDWRQ